MTPLLASNGSRVGFESGLNSTRPELDRAKDAAMMLLNRANDLNTRLEAVSNRLFGAVPTLVPRPSEHAGRMGAVAELRDVLDNLHEQLSRLDDLVAVVERL
jgi:hypothetical protein